MTSTDNNQENRIARANAGSLVKHPWIKLLLSLVLMGVMAFALGPWLEKRIPVFNRMVQIIEERDIDSGAYFYTEIKASYEGEQFLRESIELSDPDEAHGSLFFFSGIALCIVILWIGYRILPLN